MSIREKIGKIQSKAEFVSAASIVVVIASYILGHFIHANDNPEKLSHLLMTITFSATSIFGIGMIIGFELIKKILKEELNDEQDG